MCYNPHSEIDGSKALVSIMSYFEAVFFVFFTSNYFTQSFILLTLYMYVRLCACRYGTLKPWTMLTSLMIIQCLKWTLWLRSRYIEPYITHSVHPSSILPCIQVGHDVSIKSLTRSVDPDTPTLWFAQDAGGAVWKIDTVVLHTVGVCTTYLQVSYKANSVWF